MPHEITLPWPSALLSPNGSQRNHWARSKARKSYKAACGRTMIEQGVKPIPADRLHVALTFCPPDRRVRDLDNMLARMKPGLDALSAAVGVDDSKFSLSIRWGDVRRGGAVSLIVGAGNE